jgi:toxin ParE1/3/4
MANRRVVLREKARDDLEQAIDWLTAEAGQGTAHAFVDAVQAATRRIAERPATGSPRWAHELDLPGLRSVRVKGHDWLIFYIARDGHIDVWRVLHGARDIGFALDETGSA